MARVERTVFISYRRSDKWVALVVFKDLVQHGYDAFIDYDGISSGDFEASIIDNIRARAHFVLLLTPSALDRCSEPEDWLRREIETAIAARRNVVPLLFDGFDFSAPTVVQQLQGALKPLRSYQAVKVYEGYFDAAMERVRNKFLATPVDTVIHPASAHAVQVAHQQHEAAALAAQSAALPGVKQIASVASAGVDGSGGEQARPVALVQQPSAAAGARKAEPSEGKATRTAAGAAVSGDRKGVVWPVPRSVLYMATAVAAAVLAWVFFGAGHENGGKQKPVPVPPPGSSPAGRTKLAEVIPPPASSVPTAPASTPVTTSPSSPPVSDVTKNQQLARYNIDIFWCDDAGVSASRQATRVKDALAAAFEIPRLRIRKLSPGGPWASGYEIRVDPEGSEDSAGKLLQRWLNTTFPQFGFTGWASAEATPNYLSVFFCPGSRSYEDLEQRPRRF